MTTLKGYQKQYLKGLAHNLKPLIFIGQNGMTDAVTKALNKELDSHELIKLKFIDFKEKEQKAEILSSIEQDTKAMVVNTIGHTAILYRQQKDPEKRKIVVPAR
jgi:RNA-binding protein